MAGRVVNKSWFQAKLRELGKTQRDLARALGIDAPAVTQLLNGNRGVSIDEAAVIANYLHLDIQTVLLQCGVPMVQNRGKTIKILGYVGAGDTVVPFEEDGGNPPLEEIEAPPGYQDGCAVIVRGDSYSPRYLDGEILAYRPNQADVGRLIGAEVVCKVIDGRMLLKRLAKGSIPGRYTLLSLSPTSPPILDVELEWAARVDWHKPR